MKTVYANLSEINELQTNVMKFIDEWISTKKTKVPLKEVIKGMNKKGIKSESTIYSLKILIKKGYIRRSVEVSNKTLFVQLRRL